MIIVGVDPGLTGGISVLKDGEPLQIFVMPLDDEGQLHKKDLVTFFFQNMKYIDHVYMEIASMRRGHSAQATFKTGRNFGIIEGILVAFNIPHTMVYSQKWSKHFPHGVEEKKESLRYKLIKEARANIVRKLYPDLDLKASPKCSKFHDGMVDSLLISLYGWEDNNNKRG